MGKRTLSQTLADELAVAEKAIQRAAQLRDTRQARAAAENGRVEEAVEQLRAAIARKARLERIIADLDKPGLPEDPHEGAWDHLKDAEKAVNA